MTLDEAIYQATDMEVKENIYHFTFMATYNSTNDAISLSLANKIYCVVIEQSTDYTTKYFLNNVIK